MDETRPKTANNGLYVGLGLGLAVVVALSIYGDASALVGKLRGYAWRWFVVGLALATANYALRFVRWQAYLGRLGLTVPVGESLLIFFAGFSMSVSPGKLGEVLKSALLTESTGVPLARSAPIVLAERLTDLVALVLLVAASSALVPDGQLIALVSGAAVLALTLLFGFPPVGRFVIGLVERMAPTSKLVPKLREAHDALTGMLSPGPFALATLLATVAWFLECLSLLAIARGFDGVTLSLGAATFAYSAPTIIGALAMLPGGLLVTEGSMTTALMTLGGPAVTPTIAAGTTLLVRLATLWWAVVLGLLALAWHRRRVRVESKSL